MVRGEAFTLHFFIHKQSSKLVTAIAVPFNHRVPDVDSWLINLIEYCSCIFIVTQFGICAKINKSAARDYIIFLIKYKVQLKSKNTRPVHADSSSAFLRLSLSDRFPSHFRPQTHVDPNPISHRPSSSSSHSRRRSPHPRRDAVCLLLTVSSALAFHLEL
uniref:Uncharacterized protein n=1 Tax=Cucumis melo TaxID=3656 RepID=A0A9I9EBM6_CUCME